MTTLCVGSLNIVQFSLVGVKFLSLLLVISLITNIAIEFTTKEGSLTTSRAAEEEERNNGINFVSMGFIAILGQFEDLAINFALLLLLLLCLNQ